MALKVHVCLRLKGASVSSHMGNVNRQSLNTLSQLITGSSTLMHLFFILYFSFANSVKKNAIKQTTKNKVNKDKNGIRSAKWQIFFFWAICQVFRFCHYLLISSKIILYSILISSLSGKLPK